jgi:hypothetical protein
VRPTTILTVVVLALIGCGKKPADDGGSGGAGASGGAGRAATGPGATDWSNVGGVKLRVVRASLQKPVLVTLGVGDGKEGKEPELLSCVAVGNLTPDRKLTFNPWGDGKDGRPEAITSPATTSRAAKYSRPAHRDHRPAAGGAAAVSVPLEDAAAVQGPGVRRAVDLLDEPAGDDHPAPLDGRPRQPARSPVAQPVLPPLPGGPRRPRAAKPPGLAADAEQLDLPGEDGPRGPIRRVVRAVEPGDLDLRADERGSVGQTGVVEPVRVHRPRRVVARFVEDRGEQCRTVCHGYFFPFGFRASSSHSSDPTVTP